MGRLQEVDVGKSEGQMDMGMVMGADSRNASSADHRDGDNQRSSWGRWSGILTAEDAWLAGLAIGLCLVLTFGFVRPATYYAPTLRAAMETIMTLFALAGAALLREQFEHEPRLRKLLLLGAVITLALTELFANALPSALHLRPGSVLSAAYPLGQLAGAAALVLAARTPSDRVLFRSRRPGILALLISTATIGVAGLAGWLLRGQLVVRSASESALTQVTGHPLALAIQIITLGLLLWAAIEFTRRSHAEETRVMQLLAAGVLLLAGARLAYLSLPRITPETVSLRDGLRLVGFGFILGAALRRDWELRTGAAHAAAVAERQRVARDLHDGLAQDLAFIAAHGERMSEDLGQEHPVTQAARHALAISREAISSLSDTSATTPRETVEAIAHELGERFGMKIVADVSCDAPLTADSRNEVARIMREAIANAARHGGAKHALVTLKRSDTGVVLRVVDDGDGVGNADEGFGIRSMRERAAGLGGTLRLRNGQIHGTELEVTFP